VDTKRIPPVVRNIEDPVSMAVEKSSSATLQVLLGPDDGAPNFIMRRFTILPGGWIPAHMHPEIEHEQVMLEGEMHLTLDGEIHRLGAGDCVLIPAGVTHAYENRGRFPVRFLCIIPRTASYETRWVDDSAEKGPDGT